LNEGIIGKNTYAYVENNPIMYVDPNGDSLVLAGILIGAIVGGVVSYNIGRDKGFSGWKLAAFTSIGAIGGGALGYIVAPAVAAFAAASIPLTIPTGVALSSQGGLSLATTTIAISGADIIGASELLAGAGYVLFANKRDIKMVDKAAKEAGMNNTERHEFGKVIEEYKHQELLPSNHNISYKELLRMAFELMGIDK
jgi:hypothetical protein